VDNDLFNDDNPVRGAIKASENRIKERLSLLFFLHVGVLWLMLDHFLAK
jgi:hypothetical protein